MGSTGLKSCEQVPLMKVFCGVLQNLTGCGKQEEVASKLLDVHHKNTENPHTCCNGSISKRKTHSGDDLKNPKHLYGKKIHHFYLVTSKNEPKIIPGQERRRSGF